MRHYQDWKVVMYDREGVRHVAGGMDAVRGLAWFRSLHAWWGAQTLRGSESVKLELWRGRKVVISLLIHLLAFIVTRHWTVLALWHHNLI